MKRRIAVVTTSRADYSHLYWPLHDLARHPGVDLKLIVMGAHLSPEFGCTVEEIHATVSKSTAKSNVCSVRTRMWAWPRRLEWLP